MTAFSFNPLSVNSLKCVSVNSQEFKIRTKIININSNEPIFYPFSIKINKFRGSCKNINDPYAKLCVHSSINNINVKVFDLMSRSNQTKHIEWHEICKCKCLPDSSVCNDKQRWNKDKCRCEYKELIDKRIKEYVIKDLFVILVILNVNVNVINNVM